MIKIPAPTAFALQEFELLLAHAPRSVQAGRVSRDVAETRVRAWAAMACLLGADHPVIAQFMEEGVVIFSNGAGPDEAERRWIAADELCRSNIWRAELARAVIKAGNQLTTPENVTRWVALVSVARALGVSPTARTAEEAAGAGDAPTKGALS